jgi:hypothetical protein
LFLCAPSSFNSSPPLSLCKALPWSLYYRNPPNYLFLFLAGHGSLLKLKYWQNSPAPSLCLGRLSCLALLSPLSFLFCFFDFFICLFVHSLLV